MDPKSTEAVFAADLISGSFFQTRKGNSTQYKRNVLVHWKVTPRIPPGTTVTLRATVAGAPYVEQPGKSVKSPPGTNYTIVKGVLKQSGALVAGRDDVEIRTVVTLATTIDIGAETIPSNPPSSEEDPIETDPC